MKEPELYGWLPSKHTVLHPEVYVDLVQHIAHAHRTRVGDDDEAQVGGRLVEMQLVVGGAVAHECVVVTAELANHVAEGEDGAENEFGVVIGD